MFVPSDEACAVFPNSSTSHPADDAAAAAAIAQYDAAKMAANNSWVGLLSRTWQSYADQGAQVAFQLRNAPTAPLNDPTLAAGVLLGIPTTRSNDILVPPAGVTLVLDDGSVQPGGSVPATRAQSVAKAADDAQFVRTFGVSPNSSRVTARKGTPRSLTVEGSAKPYFTGPGTPAAATPDNRYGYALDCSSPGAVSMLPVGEPAYPNGFVAGDGSASSSTGISAWWWLGLAAVVYFADREDKRRGRRG